MKTHCISATWIGCGFSAKHFGSFSLPPVFHFHCNSCPSCPPIYPILRGSQVRMYLNPSGIRLQNIEREGVGKIIVFSSRLAWYLPDCLDETFHFMRFLLNRCCALLLVGSRRSANYNYDSTKACCNLAEKLKKPSLLSRVSLHCKLFINKVAKWRLPTTTGSLL